MSREEKIVQYREYRARAIAAGSNMSEFSQCILVDAKAIVENADQLGFEVEWSNACLEAAEGFATYREALAEMEAEAMAEEDYGPSYGQAMQKQWEDQTDCNGGPDEY